MSQVPQQNPEVPQVPQQNPQVPQQNPQVPLQNPHFQHQDPEVPPQHPQVPPQDQQISVPKGKGRRRVDTSQKIENEANREVTFSKRRNGLFKKATELVTLCGVQLMMIIFSPRGKPYSFGHPSVDNIIDRWQTGITGPTDPTDNIMAAERDENSRRLNMQLTEAQAMLEAETHRELELQHAMAVRRTQHRWEAPLEELSTEEILQFQAALKALQVNVETEKKRRMQQQQQQNPLAFQPGPSASSSLGVSGNVFPPFPGSPNPVGEGVSGFPQFLDGSSSSSGPNPFGDLPFPAGASSSGPSVADDLPPFPICYSSVAVSSGGPGGLPPFPGQASSFGRGGALTFPPGPRSFPGEASSSGHGSAVPFPPGQSSFGPGEGSGSGSGSGSGGGQRRGLHVRGSGRGRGHPSGSGRGFS